MILTERAPLMVLLGLCIGALSAPHSHAQTADETARELSNPSSALASLANKVEIRAYDGDLPGAGDRRRLKACYNNNASLLRLVLLAGPPRASRPASYPPTVGAS